MFEQERGVPAVVFEIFVGVASSSLDGCFEPFILVVAAVAVAVAVAAVRKVEFRIRGAVVAAIREFGFVVFGVV